MSFWRGKRVCVTGGAGFLGQHLTRLLVDAGADVCVLDNFSRPRPMPFSALVDAKYWDGNATAQNTCYDAFKGTFAIFNLAATVAGVDYNQAHNLGMFAQNMSLQTVPATVAAQLQVPHFLQVSSVCVYAPGYNAPCQEEHGHTGEPVGANAGYAWAKRMGERAVWWSTLPHAVIVRPSNLYGPGDHFDDKAHVIPALIRKAIHDDEIVVNGTGREQREFLYVEDAARGMMHALEHGEHKQAYNLGTNGETLVSMADLVRLIQAATGTQSKPVRFANQFDAGDDKRWSDCRKLKALGFASSIPLIWGIDQTVEWYRSTL